MRSFKDPSLSNGVFFLDLLNAIKPGYVDYNLVNQGNGDEEKRQNGESKHEHTSTQCECASVRDATCVMLIYSQTRNLYC
jgi:hypothetical protein